MEEDFDYGLFNDAKLNSQGMSRDCKALMECIVADEGELFASVDLTSGEPSVIAHFSKDKRYYHCNFGGIGKKPYYENKVLMLDDMYLCGASVAPTGKDKMLELFNSTWEGVPFDEQWVINKKVITKDPNVAPLRGSHKTLILGMGYGMGPAKMVTNAADEGFKISLKDARAFHRAYWDTLFPGVKALRKRMEAFNKANGYIITPFGFRSFPSIEKSLNYYIQGSVSGIIDMLQIKFYALAPWAKHKAVIHDELVFSFPENMLEETKAAMDKALQSLNDNLKWSIKIRTGFVEGKDFYAAH